MIWYTLYGQIVHMRYCNGQVVHLSRGSRVREEFHECAWPSGIPELFREPRRHERRDAAEHRQRILEVARHLFAKLGVEAVSMHQIALAAGIGQGTLYRRYANKRELCLDLLREQYERFGEEIATLLAQASTAPALERLESVLATMVLFLEEQGTMGGLVAGTERRDGPCNEADLSRHIAFQQTPWYRWLHELLAGLLTEAVERSELAALDIPYTADVMLAALHPAVYRFQRQERGFSSERIVQGLRHIYIDGVKAPSAPAGRADEQPL
jgi:AcrR family transcriptional regulator